MKAWLMVLTITAGLTWVTSGLSNTHRMDANSNPRANTTEPAPKPSAPGAPGKEQRRNGPPMMGGMGMMNGMMERMMGGGMMSGGGMMDGCPMMNDKRPNDQWQPAPPAR